MRIQPFSKTYDGVTVLDFPGLEFESGKIHAVIRFAWFSLLAGGTGAAPVRRPG